MKILFITDNFPPEVNAPATRTYEHCREWIQSGAEITIITCTPNFPNGKVYQGYKNKLYQKEIHEGITIIRVWSYIAPNNGFIKRVLDYFSFSIMAFLVGVFQKHDIIIATSPQFFTTWSAWGISKIRSKPWIFELRDLWPESIRTVGAMKEGIALRLLEKIELALYHDANYIIPVTNAFKENLIKRGVDAEKIKVITNGANIKYFFMRKKEQQLLKELNLTNKFVFGYIGTHGMAHSLDFIVQSIAKIDSDSIHFLFIGDGSMKSTIIELASKLSLKNITFLDSIPKEEVPRYLSIIDVSLAPLIKSDTFKTVIPSKIFEASAMQKPTLLGVEGEAQKILEHYHAGLCFKPEEEDDFISKVYRLAKDKEAYSRYQKGCSALAQAYNRQLLAKQMLQHIETLYQEKTNLT